IFPIPASAADARSSPTIPTADGGEPRAAVGAPGPLWRLLAYHVPTVQRACDGCEEDRPPTVGEVLRSDAGRPLDGPTRAYFGSRFGHDFDDVRVHSGPRAAASANALQANAYTVGSDI